MAGFKTQLSQLENEWQTQLVKAFKTPQAFDGLVEKLQWQQPFRLSQAKQAAAQFQRLPEWLQPIVNFFTKQGTLATAVRLFEIRQTLDTVAASIASTEQAAKDMNVFVALSPSPVKDAFTLPPRRYVASLQAQGKDVLDSLLERIIDFSARVRRVQRSAASVAAHARTSHEPASQLSRWAVASSLDYKVNGTAPGTTQHAVSMTR